MMIGCTRIIRWWHTMLKHSDNNTRFVMDSAGRLIDTEIEPKVLAAQAEYARKGKKKLAEQEKRNAH